MTVSAGKLRQPRSTAMPPGKSKLCPHCSRSFNDHSNYRRHLRTHTNQRPYQCEVCQAQFTTNQNRKRHIQLVHSDLLPTTTPTPSTALTGEETEATPWLPSTAMQVAPTREHATKPVEKKPVTIFVCSNCEQELSSRPKLNRHLKYSCPFRDDVFLSSSSSSSGSSSSSNGSSMDGDGDHTTYKDEEDAEEETGEDDGINGVDGKRSKGVFGRHRHRTKRSRRILTKRHVAHVMRHSPSNMRPLRETNGIAFSPSRLSLPLASDVWCGREALWCAAQSRRSVPSRIVCPFGDCAASFRTRRRWMAHVANTHPKEHSFSNAATNGTSMEGAAGMAEERSVV